MIQVWPRLCKEKGDFYLFHSIALNPDLMNLPPLDPKDAFLLADPSSTGAYPNNGSSQSGSSTIQPTLANVSWLRKTEYISRESSQRQGGQEPYVIPLTYLFLSNVRESFRKNVVSASIDVSRNAQLRDIDASFAAQNEHFSLEQLHHPNKPDVTAVESYPILPDANIWANQYDLFRFSERPGERPVDVSFVLFWFLSCNSVFDNS